MKIKINKIKPTVSKKICRVQHKIKQICIICRYVKINFDTSELTCPDRGVTVSSSVTVSVTVTVTVNVTVTVFR